MNEQKFTPGPWEVKPAEEGVHYIRVRGTQLGKTFKIANCPFLVPELSEQAIINAHAIAATPELYEALIPFAKILDSLRTLHVGGKTYADLDDDYNVYAWHIGTELEHMITLGDVRKAVAALAKARGES